MRRMAVKAFGEALTPEEVARPAPGPGEVLLRVRAASVNFADTLMVTGQYQERPEPPFAPGLEVCGVVEAGEGVAAGTRVAALVGHGGFAEYAVAPAAACVAVPDDMADAEAACFQVAYGSAHLSLLRARLAAGETLLVLGAGGGTGLTAVELGKLMGATVIAVASSEEKRALARQKGADHALSSSPDALRDAVKALGGADVAFDPVGGDYFRAAMRATNFGGRLIPFGFASGAVPQIPANHLLVKNLDVIGVYWGAYLKRDPATLRASMEQLLAWRAAGRLSLTVSDILPLEQANEALALLRDRKARGKVAVTMG